MHFINVIKTVKFVVSILQRNAFAFFILLEIDLSLNMFYVKQKLQQQNRTSYATQIT